MTPKHPKDRDESTVHVEQAPESTTPEKPKPEPKPEKPKAEGSWSVVE